MDKTAAEQNSQFFMVRMAGDKLEVGKKSGALVLGWSKARDLQSTVDWYEFKRRLASAYPEWTVSNRSIANMASSLYLFLHKVKRGDLAIVPSFDGFYPVRVTSDPYYIETADADDTAWRINGEWLSLTPIPRGHASYPLQKRLKGRQTVLDITDLGTDILEALSRDAPPSVAGEITSALSGPLLAAIKKYINENQLEDLVRRLATAAGARASISPKKDSRAGDVDVTAVYDLGIGNTGATMKIAYQIKHHEGMSHAEGLQQLIDRMDKDPTIDRACFVTVAKEISPEALTLAEENGIIIVTERDLVEWILSTGLAAIGY